MKKITDVEISIRKEIAQNSIDNSLIEGATFPDGYIEKLDEWAHGKIEMSEVREFIDACVQNPTTQNAQFDTTLNSSIFSSG